MRHSGTRACQGVVVTAAALQNSCQPVRASLAAQSRFVPKNRANQPHGRVRLRAELLNASAATATLPNHVERRLLRMAEPCVGWFLGGMVTARQELRPIPPRAGVVGAAR